MDRKQFSLSEWLQDKSRKVVTRDGKPVRIVCWDKLGNYPIIGCIKYSDDYEYFESFTIKGSKYTCNCENTNDLFFVDEEEKTIDDTEMNSLAYLTELGYTCIPPKKEEKLTEFEKKLKEVLYEHATTNTSSEEKARQYTPELLDLARKEFEKEVGDKCWEAHLKGEEALKD